jgi:TonB family protein
VGVRSEKSLFRRSLEISLLLHLLLIFLVAPSLKRAWPTSDAAAVELVQPPLSDDQPPLEFEFVDLAEEREEEPVSDQVPLSDLDRRAHGGEGEAADRPSTQGNTPQLVQADGAQAFGAGSPPQAPGQQVPQVPPPERPQEEPLERPTDERQTEPDVEGAGDEAPKPEAQQPAIQLPPPGSWALPPDQGGLPEMPHRDDGGQVDTGGLSFDTQWYDWGPYAKAMLAKIRRHWRIPEIAMMGVQGRVRIRFFIERDGTVTGLRIVDESGKPPMDFAARDAIADCSPFEPLPVELGGAGREGVTITFFYNRSGPDRRRR